jgi:dTDP-4-dehydrorhamnose 3,5-epimerase
MINNVIIKNINKNDDERGWLAEFWRNDELEYQPVMAYLSVTKPGVIRGPHEHIKQTDCFIFLGPGDFEVHLWDHREASETNREYQKIIAGENTPTIILVPPGVVHGYKCISTVPGYCINLPDKLYKGTNKADAADEIRWENDAKSPYRIL